MKNHSFMSNEKEKKRSLKIFYRTICSTIEENFDNQRNLCFDKSKVNIFLKDLNSKSNLLTYKDNIEELYNNFTTTLSTSFNKFSFEVSCKKIIERPTLGMIKNVKFLGNTLGYF